MKKIIHYCWFGGNQLPEKTKKCISSWKRFFPDYEIIEWNEGNFDVNCCDYSKEAYLCKKWAFVSDFARFKILNEYGGIYFDTDVEVIKSFDDIIEKGSFVGCEKYAINPGLCLGLDLDSDNNEAKSLICEIIDYYKEHHFLYPDGSMNQKTIVEYTTNIFAMHGYTPSASVLKIAGITIYPGEYFCPMDPESGIISLSDNTHSIHHYDASWYGDREIFIVKIMKNLKKVFPVSLSRNLAVFIGTVKYDGLLQAIKRTINRVGK